MGIRSQKTDDRGQKADDGGQKADDGRRKGYQRIGTSGNQVIRGQDIRGAGERGRQTGRIF